ncbi:uncharacterized protein si:ch211-142k18.1 [Heptranchias perlo]|uniref:uncharacterized protein si:ch211-142k18.1 n=1 Tax=Heptranchias perlo TaxID=212740 RepID=UPI003559BD68
MRLLWTMHCILTCLLPDCGAENGEDHTSKLEPSDSFLYSFLNNTLMADSAAGLVAIDQEELLNVCAITVMTSAMTFPSGHVGANPATQEDLQPVKGRLESSGSVLETLASVVDAEIGKVSYQSMISETVLDIKQQNEKSNSIMTEISQSLDSDPTSDSHVEKFKKEVWKMEAMLHAIDHLASQVERMSDTLSLELSQMESTLHQKAK